MAKTFEGQHEDEEVQHVFRQHPIVMRRQLIYGLLAFTVGSLPLSVWPLEVWPWWSLGIGFLVGLLIFGYRYVGYHFSVYIITTERLIEIKQKGFFDRKVVDIALNRIQSVNYEISGLQATLFKFGTIIVQTYVGELTLKYIHNPSEVQQLLNTIIRSVKPLGIEEALGHAREGEEQYA